LDVITMDSRRSDFLRSWNLGIIDAEIPDAIHQYQSWGFSFVRGRNTAEHRRLAAM